MAAFFSRCGRCASTRAVARLNVSGISIAGGVRSCGAATLPMAPLAYRLAKGTPASSTAFSEAQPEGPILRLRSVTLVRVAALVVLLLTALAAGVALRSAHEPVEPRSPPRCRRRARLPHLPSTPWPRPGTRATTSVAQGGWQIEYADEDPEIHRLFERELARHGVVCCMKGLAPGCTGETPAAEAGAGTP